MATRYAVPHRVRAEVHPSQGGRRAPHRYITLLLTGRNSQAQLRYHVATYTYVPRLVGYERAGAHKVRLCVRERQGRDCEREGATSVAGCRRKQWSRASGLNPKTAADVAAAAVATTPITIAADPSAAAATELAARTTTMVTPTSFRKILMDKCLNTTQNASVAKGKSYRQNQSQV